STPPLTAIPETKWIEKGEELIIGLKYSGGDASAKTAILTSLPAQGQLNQYDGGVKGDLISSVPANVSDQGMRVIYTASGNTGNGAGSFNFKIHDNTGDSPEATFTINVSPPGVPNLLNVARSTGVEIEFDRPMSDPSGNQSQFAVSVNGSPHTIASCSLKPGDPYSILLTMEIPIVAADAVLVEYTRGDVTAISGGFLESFYNMPVTLLSQTITFNAIAPKTYGDAPFALSSSASSHLGMAYSSSDLTVAEILSNMVTIRAAGTIQITALQAGNAVYAPAKYIRELTINKADLVFTADNKTRRYLEPNPEFTYTISGFVNGEDQSVIDVLPTAGTTATESSSAGQYPISFSGVTDNDYNFVFVDGTLTITKIPQTISFTDIPEKLLVTKSFTLAAQSTSGLPVLFESLTPEFATVSGNQLTGVSKGAARIRAYNDGNENYEAADTVATVEIYSTHRDILYLFTPNNDGINDLWEIPELASYGKSDVRIYNRWGMLVFSSPDYNNTWNGTSNGKDLPEGAYYFIIKTQNAGTITVTVNIVR
ncbi:MAG: gliding motility-associated C-terminal domain-containing protein, partial [Bacteroidales bacterium]